MTKVGSKSQELADLRQQAVANLQRLERLLERVEQPCVYGHVHCASYSGGPCTDERLTSAEEACRNLGLNPAEFLS